MKDIKDNFTAQSDLYAKYRPDYPPQLYEFLLAQLQEKKIAWDCATGNGQVAGVLSQYFEKIYATDISDQQIKNAVKKDNIFYTVQRSETTDFPDNIFDLITVAQSIHWFDFDLFYKEVTRTIKANGILAIIGYGLLTAGEELDKIIHHFYYDIIGPYWDKERKYLDENYRTIPFPFKEIKSPDLVNNFEWRLDELTGYFETWSAVQHYKKENKQNPVEIVKAELKKIWPANNTMNIQFPILLRVAGIEK